MQSNVINFTPTDGAEPIGEAVREISARVASLNGEKRRLFARLEELRGTSHGQRRRRTRTSAVIPSRPVTFYAIEEAEASDAATPLQVARGGR